MVRFCGLSWISGKILHFDSDFYNNVIPDFELIHFSANLIVVWLQSFRSSANVETVLNAKTFFSLINKAPLEPVFINGGFLI